MKHRYFLVDQDVATAAIAEGNQILNEIAAIAKEVAEKYGAYRTYGYIGYQPYCLAFLGREHSLKKHGFKEPVHRREGGQDFYLHEPAKNTKLGKQVLEDLRRIKGYNFREEFTKKHGVEAMVIGGPLGRGMAMHHTSLTIKDDNTLFVSIPCDPESRDPFPAIPAYFTEIKHSEFIAATEEAA